MRWSLLLTTFCCSSFVLLSIAHEIPKVVVVTVATEATDGLKRLLRSAEAFDIPIEVLGLGEEWKGGDTRVEQGGGQKIRILQNWIKQYKDQQNTMVIFVDAYDVVFTAGIDTILTRYFENFDEFRVVFGAEPFCWPDESLAAEYPLVDFGKRYLNSGLFMGFAPELYKIISLKEVADKDDDQLYYTMIYLDEKLRRSLKITIDSMSRIFQNLNGVVNDVQLVFNDDGDAQAYNAAYNTHPVIIHGNGPSKAHLNYLGNYVGKKWSFTTGCSNCGDKSHLNLKDKREEEFPMVTVGFFVTKPIPFVEEVLEYFAQLDYPKKKIALYIFNSQSFSIKTIMDFLAKYGKQYYSKKIINGATELSEREGREQGLEFARKFSSDFYFALDGDAAISNSKTLRHLIEYSVNYDIGIVTPLLTQPGRPFSTFWGDIDTNGYYKRSEDYIAIVNKKRVGYFNVPFTTTAVLMSKDKLEQLKKPYSYNMQYDPDMSFCQYAREHGHFMYVENEEDFGFLVMNDDFAENVNKGYWHPEMWEIFMNRQLWEKRYLHPKYWEVFNSAEVPQACPDVYDYPLLSERFCAEIIEEMEGYGKWSTGTNEDNRLAGGYENVPTRDIHMNQIGYERHWLYFMDEYVEPMQSKVFIGYNQKPISSHMMFVVRYKPDEQSSLRPHHDASTYSIDIALNKKGRDYEGGGVHYVRYNCTVPADEVGYAMMFPGRLTHLHEGLPTTSGTRYILVSFINP